MACSRPPGPMTSTFTVSKGTWCTPQAPKLCRPPDMLNFRGGASRPPANPRLGAPGAGHNPELSSAWHRAPGLSSAAPDTGPSRGTCPVPAATTGHNAIMPMPGCQVWTCPVVPENMPAPGFQDWTCPVAPENMPMPGFQGWTCPVVPENGPTPGCRDWTCPGDRGACPVLGPGRGPDFRHHGTCPVLGPGHGHDGIVPTGRGRAWACPAGWPRSPALLSSGLPGARAAGLRIAALRRER